MPVGGVAACTSRSIRRETGPRWQAGGAASGARAAAARVPRGVPRRLRTAAAPPAAERRRTAMRAVTAGQALAMALRDRGRRGVAGGAASGMLVLGRDHARHAGPRLRRTGRRRSGWSRSRPGSRAGAGDRRRPGRVPTEPAGSEAVVAVLAADVAAARAGVPRVGEVRAERGGKWVPTVLCVAAALAFPANTGSGLRDGTAVTRAAIRNRGGRRGRASARRRSVHAGCGDTGQEERAVRGIPMLREAGSGVRGD